MFRTGWYKANLPASNPSKHRTALVPPKHGNGAVASKSWAISTNQYHAESVATASLPCLGDEQALRFLKCPIHIMKVPWRSSTCVHDVESESASTIRIMKAPSSLLSVFMKKIVGLRSCHEC